MSYDRYPPQRRPWLIALPLAIFVLIALAWTGFWFYAASRAATTIAGWREREAQVGRIHTCADQSIGGYPFRIEVRCTSPSAELRNADPPLSITARDSIVAAQVYDPTLLIGEFTGPLTIAETGRMPMVTADWSLAQVSVRGSPRAPERVSIVLDKPQFSRIGRGTMEPVVNADHLELHGRIASGTAADHPAIEVALRLGAATAPTLHPLTAQPTDGEITALLVGLKDYSPKPWPVRFRELQAAGGHIEITDAHLTQGDIAASGTGTLSLTANGGLDGQIKLTVAGLDKLVTLLGADQKVSQYLAQKAGGMTMDRIASGLDRIMPGLGGAVRNNSGSIAAAGIGMLGEPAELDGKRAVTLPLRFADGAVFLGPIPVGQTPALF